MAKKAEKVSIRIFQAKISSSPLSVKGFTLVELMVSLAIIAVIISFGAPRIAKSFGSPLKTTTRKIVLLTKQLHHSARLKNKTYRLVLEFGSEENKNPAQFYVESSSKGGLVDVKEYDRYGASFSKKKKSESQTGSSNDSAPDYAIDKEFVKRPEKFPKGVSLVSVDLENVERPVSEGTVAIHFFPQGLIQKAIIHLKSDGGKDLSLIIHPLTGRTDIESGLISLRDLEK